MKKQLGTLLKDLGKIALRGAVITTVVVLLVIAGGTFVHWMISQAHNDPTLHAQRGRTETKSMNSAKPKKMRASSPCDAAVSDTNDTLDIQPARKTSE